jgi:hypothetical protein
MPDESARVDRRMVGNFERHVQTVLISIATAALLFAAKYFYDDNRENAIAKSQLEVLTAQVLEMRSDLKAMQANYVRPDEVRDLQRRVLELERTSKR